MPQTKPEITYLENYQPYDFIIESIELQIDVYATVTTVKAELACKRNPLTATAQAPLYLNGEAMHLQVVLLNGKPLAVDEYHVDAVSLTILNVPDQFILETQVEIKPHENTALCGLYQSRSNLCTQCEPEGFRRITYFPDRPDVMTRFTTIITADQSQYPILLSNGNLIESRLLADNRHWVHWEDPSLKPSYLYALVAGDFDVLHDQFTTLSQRVVDLYLYLEKGYADQGAYALEALKKAMHWDEQKFGREYDLDIYMIVAVSDFNMGAMENKGLNIFNTRYVLAKPETATDTDYVNIENVIGHEYFHNWTGNRITCRDWFQLTLKEGLTVFRDQIFTEDMTSPGVARIDTANVVRNLQFQEDAGPTAHPIRPQSYLEINNFYTHTVYRKGAEVIRMLRTFVGETHFRQGMDLYFARHDGQAVTTEDFVQAIADVSGRDFTQFKRWYDQAGTPVLDVASEYDAQQQVLKLTVRQSCPATPGQTEKQPFHLPLTVGLIAATHEDMPTQLAGEQQAQTQARVLELDQAVQTFTFVHVKEKPVISLLRNFSAPVKLNYTYTDEELLWLFQGDSDPFSRYEAGQQFIKQLVIRLAADQQHGVAFVMDERLITAYRSILNAAQQDAKYLARLLAMPTLSYLAQQIQQPDLEALHNAREFVLKALAVALHDEWMQQYEHLLTAQYQLDVQSMGQRALKNLALSFLTATQDQQCYQLAYQQMRKANNMTDEMGGLLALNNYDCSWRHEGLAEFYQKWQQQALVVNKWFSLHATSTLPTTLSNVIQCLQHPAFDLCNPNNVYALLGAFGMNLLRFHAIDGKGYQFLAEQVLKIDAMNPQVAARILQPFIQWRQFDEGRQSLMKIQLERILQQEKCSSDVYELVAKSLS